MIESELLIAAATDPLSKSDKNALSSAVAIAFDVLNLAIYKLQAEDMPSQVKIAIEKYLIQAESYKDNLYQAVG